MRAQSGRTVGKIRRHLNGGKAHTGSRTKGGHFKPCPQYKGAKMFKHGFKKYAEMT